MSEFEYTKKETYKIIREKTDQNFKGYTDSSNKEDIIQTSDGTIWGIKYNSTDSDKSNYENVSIRKLSDKNGDIIPNSRAKNVIRVADLLKEYQVFGEKRNIVKEDAYVITEDNDGYNTVINNKGLVSFLLGKLSQQSNNTNISFLEEGFISGENNSDFIIMHENKTYSQPRKPPAFEPEPENRNKIEKIPEDIKHRTPNQINFFERK